MTTAKCFTLEELPEEARITGADGKLITVDVTQVSLDGTQKKLAPYSGMSLRQAVLHSLMMLPPRDADIFVSQRTSDIVDIFVRYRS